MNQEVIFIVDESLPMEEAIECLLDPVKKLWFTPRKWEVSYCAFFEDGSKVAVKTTTGNFDDEYNSFLYLLEIRRMNETQIVEVEFSSKVENNEQVKSFEAAISFNNLDCMKVFIW